MILPTDKKLATIDHDKVRSLDPLGFDEYRDVVIAFNKNDEVRELIAIAQDLTEKAIKLNTTDLYKALAIVRDLGIVAGSIKRLQIAPVKEVEQIDGLLLELSTVTGLPARDTLLHYVLWNPEGDRVRTYTGEQEEVDFINKLRSVLPMDEETLYKLTEMPKVIVGVKSLKQASAALDYPLEQIKDEMATEIASPFYKETLQEYFADVIIRGKHLAGPCQFLSLA
ncbi:hypothetical protein V6R21_25525 [Limibacter armeniacum]|uniref:hypothetical protein n=1 Tax=Limibacter armeniacum TaxID=466084 RepID=UPI002FE50A2B